MLLAALFFASALTSTFDPGRVAPQQALVASLRAREAFVRSLTIDCVSASTIAKAPLVLERSIAAFHGESAERWTRFRLDEPGCGGLVGATRPPAALVERLRACEPEMLTVYDGAATLEIARRVEVEGWSGALHPGLHSGARRGALNVAGLIVGDRWLSEVLADLELVRVDRDLSAPDQRVWLFARDSNGKADTHLLVTSDTRDDLVVFHRVNELDRSCFEQALDAYAPGVVATWTTAGETFESVVETSIEKNGVDVPLRARSSADVAWLTFRSTSGADDTAFDARRAPTEAGETPLSVVDARTLEPLDYARAP